MTRKKILATRHPDRHAGRFWWVRVRNALDEIDLPNLPELLPADLFDRLPGQGLCVDGRRAYATEAEARAALLEAAL